MCSHCRSVFFNGYIERVGKTFLHSQWLPVRVGANTDGVYVISTEKEVSIVISTERVEIVIENNHWLIKMSIYLY